MKVEYTIETIPSPVTAGQLIINKMTLDTPTLNINVFAAAVDVTIQSRAMGGGTGNLDRHMSYDVVIKPKDLLAKYPARHSNNYITEMSIGPFVEPNNSMGSIKEARWVQIISMESDTEFGAAKHVFAGIFNQLLRTHPHAANIVTQLSSHICNQLLDLGAVTIPNGDFKTSRFVVIQGKEMLAERLWRVHGSCLTLKQTLLTEQLNLHTRQTHLIPANAHHVYELDGEITYPSGGVQNMGGGFNQLQVTGGAAAQMRQQQQMYPQTQMPGMQPGGYPQQLSGMQPGGYPHMQPLNRMLLATTPLQLANLIAFAKHEGLDKADAEAFAQWGIAQLQAGDELPGYTAIAQWKQSLKAQGSDAAPSYCNRSLSDRDMGGRDTTTPILGKIEQIEIEAILIGEDSVEVVSEDRCNAYGVYRRERQGKSAVAVSVGDFLKSGEATDYAVSLAEKYDVAVKSMRAVTQ